MHSSPHEQRGDRCSPHPLMAQPRHLAGDLGIAALNWVIVVLCGFLFSNISVPSAHCLDAQGICLFSHHRYPLLNCSPPFLATLGTGGTGANWWELFDIFMNGSLVQCLFLAGGGEINHFFWGRITTDTPRVLLLIPLSRTQGQVRLPGVSSLPEGLCLATAAAKEGFFIWLCWLRLCVRLLRLRRSGAPESQLTHFLEGHQNQGVPMENP